MARTEVTVRGAGIFGLSCAWACLKAGASVTVIDPFGPGAGASGGLVGALAPHVPDQWNEKKQFQFESLIMAEPFWEEVEDISGRSPGYKRLGRIQPLADEKSLTLAQERAASARTLWHGLADWRVLPIPAQSEWAPQSPTGQVIHDTLTARMHPRMACDALVAAIRAKGGRVESEGPNRGAVIWATGVAGLQSLSEDSGKSLGNGVKGQAALLAHDAHDMPQIYAGGVHVVPHEDGTVAIGSTSEREYTDPFGTDELLDDVVARAREVVPALRGAPVIDRWAGLRPRAKTRAPVLGTWPGRPGHYIANGGFKIGFGMAPKVAEVMSALMLDGRDTIPDGFRVEDSL